MEWITSWLEFLAQLGAMGIIIGLAVEWIPSEIVLAYGGWMVSQGTLHFLEAVIAGVIGGTIAQWFLYFIGRIGGRPFALKYGKYFFVQKHSIDRLDSLVEKHGSVMLFIARFIPVVRHAVSIPAGISKMPFVLFTVYTAIAMIPWSIAFIVLGIQLGSHWWTIKEVAHHYYPHLLLSTGAAMVIYFFIYKWKQYSQK
ncbi:DedA family protein [Mangrovibacillus cuniculi]|uniref:DedA family protein n=1 Tax=Mangrovibacillus cuniculi TaxID=2593652 RepID=A0A7S8CAX1_9BACI|nr:DedA family protein [Mangrovibacillus cuniculi]QPC46593.1 DedA family protein [Mangrovibacillus cuniculi]